MVKRESTVLLLATLASSHALPPPSLSHHYQQINFLEIDVMASLELDEFSVFGVLAARIFVALTCEH